MISQEVRFYLIIQNVVFDFLSLSINRRKVQLPEKTIRQQDRTRFGS